jgi:hypothetical protein
MIERRRQIHDAGCSAYDAPILVMAVGIADKRIQHEIAHE